MLAGRRRKELRALSAADAEPGEQYRAALPALDPRRRIWWDLVAIVLLIALTIGPGGAARNLILVPLVIGFWTRSRAFVITDRRVLMYRCSFWNKANNLIATWPVEDVTVERWTPRAGWWSTLSLRLPSGVHTGYAVRAYFEDAVAVAAVLGSSEKARS